MKKIVLGALMALGMASGANAATVFSETFQGGGFGVFTASGQVQNANSATYGPCCGAFGDAGNQFIAFGGGEQPSGTISTALSTVLGQLYTVSFDYGALGGGTDPLTVSYGALSQTVSRPADNNLASTFANSTFTFTGTGTTQQLQFASAGGSGVDAVVDNITVGTVPEASTWAMMIFGMGAIGGTLRRRVRSAGRFANA